MDNSRVGARQVLEQIGHIAALVHALGVRQQPGIGFEAITVRFAIDADASRDDLEALIAQAQKRSAAFDIVANPTKVLVELA